MKKLFLFLILALFTTQGYSQINTRVSKDSLVYLPQSLVGMMVSDLDVLDTLKVSYKVLEKDLSRANTKIAEKDAIIANLKRDLKDAIVEIDTLTINGEGKDSKISMLSRDCRRYKHQRNFAYVIGILLPIGVHINWKYGGTK